MSFKLFIANVFGLIKPTKKIEAERAKVLENYLNYCEFEKSHELKEYIFLERLINSASFKQKKLEIQKLKYKGSTEENLIKEFSKLDADSSIKKFLQTRKSEELKRFFVLDKTDLVAYYNKIKSDYKSLSFFVPKKDEVKKEEQRIKDEFQKIKNSDDWRFFTSFGKSSEYRNYLKIVNSHERKRYDELVSKFNEAKETEEKDKKEFKEFKKLKKKQKLSKFYKTLGSAGLKRYQKLTDSDLLSRYNELKAKVKSFSFFAPKSEEVKHDEQRIRNEFNKIANSSDWLFYKKFMSSAAYKNYLKVYNSPKIKRYEELLEICNSDDFKNNVAYLKDDNKWKKTEEYDKENRFEGLKKLPQLINYLKYKDSDVFDFHKNWEIFLEDNFNEDKIDSQKWMTKSFIAERMLGQNFSQTGDIHAFSDGKNVHVKNKTLKIEIRKEKTKGMQWIMPIGLVEKEFDYSSGILTSEEKFWWKYGILEAKVKYSPSKNFVDIIYLLGGQASPQINLFECGHKNRVGFLSKSDDSIISDVESISGLKNGEYYIFRLEWSEGLLKWSVNNKEILRLNNNVPSNEMHINFSSIIISDKSNNLPHQFEIDWVRVYKKVKN